MRPPPLLPLFTLPPCSPPPLGTIHTSPILCLHLQFGARRRMLEAAREYQGKMQAMARMILVYKDSGVTMDEMAGGSFTEE